MKTSLTRFPKILGFSLIELLVVIAVIAIVASLALPNLVNISDRSIHAKDRRNAQTVASVAAAAKAAGVTNVLSGTNAVFLLQPPGVTVLVGGGGYELTFSVSEMSLEEQNAAAKFLEPATNDFLGVQLEAN